MDTRPLVIRSYADIIAVAVMIVIAILMIASSAWGWYDQLEPEELARHVNTMQTFHANPNPAAFQGILCERDRLFLELGESVDVWISAANTRYGYRANVVPVPDYMASDRPPLDKLWAIYFATADPAVIDKVCGLVQGADLPTVRKIVWSVESVTNRPFARSVDPNLNEIIDQCRVLPAHVDPPPTTA